MNIPSVSIIVPVYKTEQYLDRCVQSLLGQTLKNIEIILVDDGSPDHAPSMCDEYARRDKRIKVIHKQNEGLGFARNSGIDIAQGEYLAFVDSDDYVDISMFEALYTEAKKQSSDICFCGYKRLKSNGMTKDIIHPLLQTKGIASPEEITDFLLLTLGAPTSTLRYESFPSSSCTSIYSSTVLREKKLRFYSERQYISEDVIFNIDFLLVCKRISFVPEALYFYCENDNSLTTTYRKDRFEHFKVFYQAALNKIRVLTEDHYQRGEIALNNNLLSCTRVFCKQIVAQSHLPRKEMSIEFAKIANDPLIRYALKKNAGLTLNQKLFNIFLKARSTRFIYLSTKLHLKKLSWG